MNISEQNLKKIHFHLLKEFKSYCWISGGAILDAFEGRTPRDVDIYFSSERDRDNAIKSLERKGSKILQVYPLGAKMRYEGIEIDLAYCGETPDKVFDRYDFTVCCVAIDKNGKFFFHADFFEHLGEKKLYYSGEAPSKGTLHFTSKAKRLKKYLKKGFSINEENLEFWLERVLDEQKRPKKPKNKNINPV